MGHGCSAPVVRIPGDASARAHAALPVAGRFDALLTFRVPLHTAMTAVAPNRGARRRVSSDGIVMMVAPRSPSVTEAQGALWLELETCGGHPVFTRGIILQEVISFLDCPAECAHEPATCEMLKLMVRSTMRVIDINARGIHVFGSRANSVPCYLAETHVQERQRFLVQARKKELVRSTWKILAANGKSHSLPYIYIYIYIPC
jgi:hypothetical protein